MKKGSEGMAFKALNQKGVPWGGCKYSDVKLCFYNLR